MNYLLVTCVSLFLVSFAVADHHTITFCTTRNLTQCNLAGATINVTCVPPTNADDGCIKDVVDKKANLTLASANSMVVNAKQLKMVYGQKLTGLENFVQYYGVAVVKKDTNFSLNELQGKKSCHTGVDRTAGWKIPVGYLLFTKKMKFTDNQYVSTSDYFGDSCASGIKNKKVSDAVKTDLCKLCNGTCEGNTTTEPFSSYNGAFKCMAAGNKDRVAFVKQTTVNDVISGAGGGKYGTANDYELLCRNGSKKAVAAFASCFIDKRPASALVTSNDMSDAMVKKMQGILTTANVTNLKNGGIVSSNCEKLVSYTDSVEKYVGDYGNHYNALQGPEPTSGPSSGPSSRPSSGPTGGSTSGPTSGPTSGAPSNLVSFALQIIAILAFVILV